MAKSDYRFFFNFRVRYSEVDGQMIVFNAHYLTYFDTAITEYFRALPYDYREQVKRTGEDFHTVKTLVEYYGPIHFDDEIEVGVRAAKVGRTSLTFRLEIHPKGSDSCLASGEVVWVNTDQRKPSLGTAFHAIGGEAQCARRRKNGLTHLRRRNKKKELDNVACRDRCGGDLHRPVRGERRDR